jgi:hypothetical protein
MARILSDDVIPDDLLAALGNLATAIFRLDDWIKDPAKYVPPNPDLPWRADGQTLTPEKTGAIDFFAELLRISSGDDDLGARWGALLADPLKFSPIDDVRGWRRRRGLDEAAKFGVVQAANVWLVDQAGMPTSRRSFYAACWTPLRAAIAAAPPASDADWRGLTDVLLGDRHAAWPPATWPKSSAFIVQFAADMLNGMLGQRSPAAPPWREALLIELGEYRRVGNKYSPEDAAASVKAMRLALGLDAA